MSGWSRNVIRQGPTLGTLGSISTNPVLGQAFLDALEAKEANGAYSQDYVDLLIAHNVAQESERRHLRNHWYASTWDNPDSQAWWPELQPIEPILREGMIQAFKKAKAFNWMVPIEAFWLMASDRVAVAIAWNERQITMIRMTPPIPDGRGTPADYNEHNSYPENIIVVQREDEEGQYIPLPLKDGDMYYNNEDFVVIVHREQIGCKIVAKRVRLLRHGAPVSN